MKNIDYSWEKVLVQTKRSRRQKHELNYCKNFMFEVMAMYI